MYLDQLCGRVNASHQAYAGGDPRQHVDGAVQWADDFADQIGGQVEEGVLAAVGRYAFGRHESEVCRSYGVGTPRDPEPGLGPEHVTGHPGPVTRPCS